MPDDKQASWNFLKRAVAPGYSRAGMGRAGTQRAMPTRMQPAPAVTPGKQAAWAKIALEDLSSGSKGPTDACRVLDATQPVKKNIKIQHHDR